MKRKILLIYFCMINFVSFIMPSKIHAQVSSAKLKKDDLVNDFRPSVLSSYLSKYNSPLSSYAQDLILAADYYQIDWRLIPAITGIESTFGKRIPFNSYNAYGWNNGQYSFSSWPQSIWHVASIMKNKYYDRGADTVVKISRIYAPPSSTWAKNVNYFINQIEKTSYLAFNL